MKNVSAGDPHSGLVHILWHDIQQRGGSIPSYEIKFYILDCIRSGLLSGLSYDGATDRVYISPQQRSVPARRVTGWHGPTTSPEQKQPHRREMLHARSVQSARQSVISPTKAGGSITKSSTDTAMHRAARSGSGTGKGGDDGGNSPTSLNPNAADFVSWNIDEESLRERIFKDGVPPGKRSNASLKDAEAKCQQPSPEAVNLSGITQAGLPSDQAIAPGGSKGLPPDSDGENASEYLIIHDGQSMSNAAAVLNVSTTGEQGEVVQLVRAFVGTGPVAVRLDGKNLGGKDAVISTIQVRVAFLCAIREVILRVDWGLTCAAGKMSLVGCLHFPLSSP